MIFNIYRRFIMRIHDCFDTGRDRTLHGRATDHLRLLHDPGAHQHRALHDSVKNWSAVRALTLAVSFLLITWFFTIFC